MAWSPPAMTALYESAKPLPVGIALEAVSVGAATGAGAGVVGSCPVMPNGELTGAVGAAGAGAGVGTGAGAGVGATGIGWNAIGSVVSRGDGKSGIVGVAGDAGALGADGVAVTGGDAGVTGATGVCATGNGAGAAMPPSSGACGMFGATANAGDAGTARPTGWAVSPFGSSGSLVALSNDCALGKRDRIQAVSV